MGALCEMGDVAVAALVCRIDDEDAGVRWRSVEALGSMGNIAKPFKEALAAKINDRDAWVQIAAVRALENLDADLVVPSTDGSTLTSPRKASKAMQERSARPRRVKASFPKVKD